MLRERLRERGGRQRQSGQGETGRGGGGGEREGEREGGEERERERQRQKRLFQKTYSYSLFPKKATSRKLQTVELGQEGGWDKTQSRQTD